MALVKDLLVDELDEHVISFCDNASRIANRDTKNKNRPVVGMIIISVKIGDHCYRNTSNKQAVMVNTVEMYGRTKTVDRHRETFGKLKNGTHTTSLPPPIKIPHPDVWPTLYEKRDGQKLVIGTQVSNALVTSSIRLDEKHDPSVGGTTVHFQLSTIKDSLACKIFLDTESMNAGLAMINDPSASSVSDTVMLVPCYDKSEPGLIHQPPTICAELLARSPKSMHVNHIRFSP